MSEPGQSDHPNNQLSSAVLELVWRQWPEAAIESGVVPPHLWNDPAVDGRTAVRADAAALLADIDSGEWASTTADLRAAARFHLACLVDELGKCDHRCSTT